MLVRAVILIPHFILLGLWAIGVALSVLVTWVWVLVMGRVPGWAFGLVGGYIRLYTRVLAYL